MKLLMCYLVVLPPLGCSWMQTAETYVVEGEVFRGKALSLRAATADGRYFIEPSVGIAILGVVVNGKRVPPKYIIPDAFDLRTISASGEPRYLLTLWEDDELLIFGAWEMLPAEGPMKYAIYEISKPVTTMAVIYRARSPKYEFSEVRAVNVVMKGG